jgi:hypothetical protein
MFCQSPGSLKDDRDVGCSQPKPIAVVSGIPFNRFSIYFEEDCAFRPFHVRNQILEHGLE